MNKTQRIGCVNNPTELTKEVPVVGTALISSGAVGYYVGSQVGGRIGAAVEPLVDAFVGGLAAGVIQEMTVRHGMRR
ncbi:hypothetical protein H6F89_18305 [Cyanobacteria bacterium FACHB-63]|nr:hypothetical protein [Cyanobacteria bacterium FACHB-63]